MPGIGIIGGGVGGTQLGLFLRQHHIAVTIHTEKTPDQQRAARISNVVVRNGLTRARERALGIDYWDSSTPDLHRFSVTVNGARTLAFAGALTPPSHVVDMRLYWARMLEEFSSRGGEVVFGAVNAREVETLASRYDLVVVASGRGSLSNLFPRLPEHSPYDEPQRHVMAGLFHGVRYPEPCGFDVVVNRGHGEILAFPIHSFEPGLTALGIEIARGGAFSKLAEVKYEANPREFESTVLGIIREYAPALFARVDADRFGVPRQLDIGYAAVTPGVRRGYIRLANGRLAVALGDAHISMDPITGQGANKASHAAWVLGEAIRDASAFDEEFCNRVTQRMLEYELPVSDACNARLVAPPPHVAGFMIAAAEHPTVADFYADGFNHPDRFWKIVSDAERTETIKKLLVAGTIPATLGDWQMLSALVDAPAAGA